MTPIKRTLSLLLALCCLLPVASLGEDGNATMFDPGMELAFLLDLGVTIVNNQAMFQGKPLYGVYTMQNETQYILASDPGFMDPNAAYGLVAYEDHNLGEPTALLPITYAAFLGYGYEARQWARPSSGGGEFLGLEKVGITPDANYAATYEGKRVAGIVDDRQGATDYGTDGKEDCVYLRLTTTVEVIDEEAFREAFDATLENLTTPAVGDGEYMQFGLYGDMYKGKVLMGFYDPVRRISHSSLTESEHDSGKLDPAFHPYEGAFLIAERDEDGRLTGFEELTQTEFTKLYRETGTIGNG